MDQPARGHRHRRGGVLIVVDGWIVAAIGMSGVASNQDAEVAMAGAAAAAAK